MTVGFILTAGIIFYSQIAVAQGILPSEVAREVSSKTLKVHVLLRSMLSGVSNYYFDTKLSIYLNCRESLTTTELISFTIHC